MQIEHLIDIGIPVLVALISYLAVRWAGNSNSTKDELIGSEPLVHQGYDPISNHN